MENKDNNVDDPDALGNGNGNGNKEVNIGEGKENNEEPKNSQEKAQVNCQENNYIQKEDQENPNKTNENDQKIKENNQVNENKEAEINKENQQNESITDRKILSKSNNDIIIKNNIKENNDNMHTNPNPAVNKSEIISVANFNKFNTIDNNIKQSIDLKDDSPDNENEAKSNECKNDYDTNNKPIAEILSHTEKTNKSNRTNKSIKSIKTNKRVKNNNEENNDIQNYENEIDDYNKKEQASEEVSNNSSTYMKLYNQTESDLRNKIELKNKEIIDVSREHESNINSLNSLVTSLNQILEEKGYLLNSQAEQEAMINEEYYLLNKRQRQLEKSINTLEIYKEELILLEKKYLSLPEYENDQTLSMEIEKIKKENLELIKLISEIKVKNNKEKNENFKKVKKGNDEVSIYVEELKQLNDRKHKLCVKLNNNKTSISNQKNIFEKVQNLYRKKKEKNLENHKIEIELKKLSMDLNGKDEEIFNNLDKGLSFIMQNSEQNQQNQPKLKVNLNIFNIKNDNLHKIQERISRSNAKIPNKNQGNVKTSSTKLPSLNHSHSNININNSNRIVIKKPNYSPTPKFDDNLLMFKYCQDYDNCTDYEYEKILENRNYFYNVLNKVENSKKECEKMYDKKIKDITINLNENAKRLGFLKDQNELLQKEINELIKLYYYEMGKNTMEIIDENDSELQRKLIKKKISINHKQKYSNDNNNFNKMMHKESSQLSSNKNLVKSLNVDERENIINDIKKRYNINMNKIYRDFQENQEIDNNIKPIIMDQSSQYNHNRFNIQPQNIPIHKNIRTIKKNKSEIFAINRYQHQIITNDPSTIKVNSTNNENMESIKDFTTNLNLMTKDLINKSVSPIEKLKDTNENVFDEEEFNKLYSKINDEINEELHSLPKKIHRNVNRNNLDNEIDVEKLMESEEKKENEEFKEMENHNFTTNTGNLDGKKGGGYKDIDSIGGCKGKEDEEDIQNSIDNMEVIYKMNNKNEDYGNVLDDIEDNDKVYKDNMGNDKVEDVVV